MYVWISPEGQLAFLWDDRLQALLSLGEARIRRASHVEPTPDGRWTADLGPSGGPVLGPFRLRQEALEAERRWLDAHPGRLPPPAPEHADATGRPPAA